MLHALSFKLIIFTFLSLNYVCSHAEADRYSGKYSGSDGDSDFILELQKQSGNTYYGQFYVEGEEFPVTASLQGQQLIGEIDEYGEVYPFIATLTQEGNLQLIDDEDDVYIFVREGNSAKQTTATKKQDSPSKVTINRQAISAQRIQTLEQTYYTPIQPGDYWYDALTGAWGYVNGPTVGFIQAGLDLPSPMPVDISGGGTSIFINGREIHPMDQQGLQQLFGVTYTGHYWMDAQGNLGPQGGPAIANVFMAIQQAQARQSSGSGSVTHGYGTTGARGTAGGGMYSGRTATGKSVFWYPGM